jgi:2-dehydro-3-deoxyphosphooctonate aldolase (KDO 8-P synthase)
MPLINYWQVNNKEEFMHTVKIGKYEVGQGHPLLLLAGPCVLEGYEHSLAIGKEVKRITEKLGMPYVFKASYDKANRSSYKSFRGPGLKEGLAILAQIKKDLGVPIVSDVHETCQVEPAAEVLDILQIPAFLCRQTDLVFAAAKTGKVVNVKKGQFLAPWDMKNIIGKVEEAGNHNLLLTERGSSFGYNTLVTDMRGLAIMRELGYPVVMDATHSVQIPGGKGTTSGGQSQYVPHMARAAAAVGVDALFLEVHDNPAEALSDGPNMVRLDHLEALLKDVLAIDKIVRGSK